MNGIITQIPIKIIVEGNPVDFASKVANAFSKSKYKNDDLNISKIAKYERKIQFFVNSEIADTIIKNLTNEGLNAW